MSRVTVRTASVMAGLAALGLLWLGVAEMAAGPTERDLNRVGIGMTQSQVVDIMGRPDRDQQVNRGGVCHLYVYKRVGRYRIVNIWFNCDDPRRVHSIDKIR